MELEALAYLKEVKADALIVREWLRTLTRNGDRAWKINMIDLAKLADMRPELVSACIRRLENYKLIRLERVDGKLYCHSVVVPPDGEKRIRAKLEELSEKKNLQAMSRKFQTAKEVLQ